MEKRLDDAERIKMQLRFLIGHTGQLCEDEIDVLMSFQEQFERKGKLSKDQQSWLEDMWRRA